MRYREIYHSRNLLIYDFSSEYWGVTAEIEVDWKATPAHAVIRPIRAYPLPHRRVKRLEQDDTAPRRGLVNPRIMGLLDSQDIEGLRAAGFIVPLSIA